MKINQISRIFKVFVYFLSERNLQVLGRYETGTLRIFYFARRAAAIRSVPVEQRTIWPVKLRKLKREILQLAQRLCGSATFGLTVGVSRGKLRKKIKKKKQKNLKTKRSRKIAKNVSSGSEIQCYLRAHTQTRRERACESEPERGRARERRKMWAN